MVPNLDSRRRVHRERWRLLARYREPRLAGRLMRHLRGAALEVDLLTGGVGSPPSFGRLVPLAGPTKAVPPRSGGARLRTVAVATVASPVHGRRAATSCAIEVTNFRVDRLGRRPGVDDRRENGQLQQRRLLVRSSLAAFRRSGAANSGPPPPLQSTATASGQAGRRRSAMAWRGLVLDWQTSAGRGGSRGSRRRGSEFDRR